MSTSRDDASSPHHLVPLHGGSVEVPRAALTAELARSGPVASLALIEAIVRHAPRARAIDRLVLALVDAPENTLLLATILGLVRLDATSAAPSLDSASVRLVGPLGATARIAALLLRGELTALSALVAEDELVAQRTALVLAELPSAHPEAPLAFAALLAALDRLQPALGVTAYRALLGDVAEATFRQLQHGADADELLGAERGALIDRLAAELPGTPDLIAARGMAWLLGALAAGDDAARSAIERASARFRDPAFHRDCAVMLGDDPVRRWPPPAP